LLTFLGRARKVRRLAGRNPPISVQIKQKTESKDRALRLVPRLTFFCAHKKKVSKENAPNATARCAGSLHFADVSGPQKNLPFQGFGHFCGKAPEPSTTSGGGTWGLTVKITKPET
jgi:hypothetical protein